MNEEVLQSTVVLFDDSSVLARSSDQPSSTNASSGLFAVVLRLVLSALTRNHWSTALTQSVRSIPSLNSAFSKLSKVTGHDAH